MLVLKFADHADLEKKGRNFDCSRCENAVKKLRKCESDREDFTSKDDNFWPIRVSKGGPSFSFCPGKATWDEDAAELLRLLETTYFLGAPLFEGCFMEQPWWYAEIIYEYMPFYESLRENQKQRAMWGSGGSGKGKGRGGQENNAAIAKGARSGGLQKMPGKSTPPRRR